MLKVSKESHTASEERWIGDRVAGDSRQYSRWRGKSGKWGGLSNVETLKTDSVCFCCVKTLGGFVFRLN